MACPGSLAELHERASRPTTAVLETLRGVDTDVLVLGAGGKMGFHLTRMLQRGLDEIGSPRRAIAVSRFRNAGALMDFCEHGISAIAVDLTQPEALDALPDSGHVFFLAGVKFGTKDDPQLLQKMNVDLPGRVAQRYRAARVVALSTGCVYGFVTPASGGSRESDSVHPPGAYAESCAGRERAFAQSSARTSLVRLNYSIDLRYGVLVDIAQKVWRGEPIDLDTGFVNVIWQGDANAYIVQALAYAASPPWIVNVTGAATLRVRDVAQRFAERFGLTAKLRGSENPTAWLSSAAQCHALWGPPQVSEDELIDWVAEWVAGGRPTLNKPTHFEVRDGKF